MKKLVMGIIILLSGSTCYLFLAGKLFSYTPVITGFTKHKLPHVIVYVQNKADYSDTSDW